MLYLKETSLPIERVCEALEKAVEANKFGVLGVHNLKEKMVELKVRRPHLPAKKLPGHRDGK